MNEPALKAATEAMLKVRQGRENRFSEIREKSNYLKNQNPVGFEHFEPPEIEETAAQRAQEMALEAQRAQEMALEAQRAQEMALEAQKVIEAHDLKFKAAFECLGKALNEIVDREEDSLRVKAQYLQVLKEPERTAQQTPKFERAFKALTTAIKAILSSDIVERIFARYSELTAPPPVVPDRKPEPSKPRPSSQGPSR